MLRDFLSWLAPWSKRRKLIEAVKGHSVGRVKALLATGADPNSRDPLGVTALLHAVNEGQLDAVATLLEAGADPNVAAAEEIPDMTIQSAPGNPLAVVERMLSMGAAGAATVTPASLSQMEAEIDRAVPESRAPKGTVALTLAAARGDPGVARALLEGGADPNAGGSALLPLTQAIMGGHVEVVRVLLEAGAEPDPAPDFCSPLVRAAAYGDSEAARLLLQAGPHSDETLGRAWKEAAARAHADVVAALLSAGADPNTEVVGGGTALVLFAAQGDLTMVEALLAAGADPNATFAFKADLMPGTALIAAVQKRDAKMVHALLGAGADPSLEGPTRRTPLQIAEDWGHTEVADMLREAAKHE